MDLLQKIERLADNWIATKSMGVTEMQLMEAEQELSRKLQSAFDEAMLAVLKELQAVGELEEGTADKLLLAMQRARQEITEEWLLDLNRKANLPYGSEQMMKDFVFEASERTMQAMSGDINKVITQGLAEGTNPRVLAKTLRENFKDLKDFEIERIARTEMHGARSKASWERIQNAGIPYKQWQSVDQPGRTRDSHLLLNGQIAPVGQPFSNGLMYPGDRGGPIEEWINCRCVLLDYFMPEGKIAPLGVTTFYERDLIDAPTDKSEQNITDKKSINRTLEQNKEIGDLS